MKLLYSVVLLLPFIPSSEGRQCGRTPIEPIGDIAGIIGGTVAEPGSWPWQVSIFNDEKGHDCGGSIIDKDWILTAAHCVDAKTTKETVIIAGAFNVNSDDDGDIYEIKKVYPHPNYNKDAVRNDIALIKLKQKIKFRDDVQPVCLPKKDKSVVETDGVKMTVTGWGQTLSGVEDSMPDRLLQVSVDTFDFYKCEEQHYDEIDPEADLDEKIQFCAASRGKDTCSGDSGGPLVRKTGYSWFQYGVVSFGGDDIKACNNRYAAGVYARVSAYCKWIKKITRKKLCT